MRVRRLLIVFNLLLVAALSQNPDDPYKILGVSKKATSQEIRRAYKKLAKEWHPDKSDDPEAQSKFVQINQAYELLSDPERRQMYDQRGITENTYRERHEYSKFYSNNPFDDLFNNAYFNFPENDITFFHRLSITSRHFDKILEKSLKVPHLVFLYTDWCFACLQTTPYFRKLMDHLEPLGVNFAAIHAAHEANLARRLSAHTLPCIVVVLDGNFYIYKETITSISRVVDFLRNHLPYKLIDTITKDNIEEFLTGWEDNKVRGLIFEPRMNVRLRYLLTAYHFRSRVSFGFVNSTELHREYQAPFDMDTVLLFNENTSRPIASISMKEIPTPTLHNIIMSNQYLALPRLSSQSILESLCPCEWNKPRKRLCVILVTAATSDHDPHRQSFRNYAQTAPYSSEKVRFAYIYHDKQSEFVNSLSQGGDFIVEPLLKVVIIWRRDNSHVKYEWFESKWEIEENLNDTVVKLESTIARLLRSSEALSYEALVKDLFDEHAKGIFGKIISKLVVYSQRFYDGLSKDQILPILSVIGTVVFIVVVGYFMAYLVRMEEESIKQNSMRKNRKSDGSNNYQPELKLHELRSEKYNGLVRLLKPGCRTLILVLDMQSREQLIPPFHKAMWPYRKNKTLLFTYMYVERGLNWYKELLQLSLVEDRELNINPRNCVGTVLAVNGYRKYFCMFHAKHPEVKGRKKQMDKINRNTNKIKDCEAAASIGFDSESSESDVDVLLEGNLLDGLPNWLDRLFEGTTQRYHVNYWPDFPNK